MKVKVSGLKRDGKKWREEKENRRKKVR